MRVEVFSVNLHVNVRFAVNVIGCRHGARACVVRGVVRGLKCTPLCITALRYRLQCNASLRGGFLDPLH